jgi:ribosomal protein L29
MTIKEIREKKDSELLKDLAQLREKIRSARFKVSFQEVKNNREVAQFKKDVAKILTVMTQRTKDNSSTK